MVDARAEFMMAQAVGDAVGATKRQIQIWTDNGVIQCLPDTDRQGRGSQRLYAKDELPAIGLVAAAAKAKLPIGILIRFAEVIRRFAYNAVEDGGYIILEVPEDPSDPKSSWIKFLDDEDLVMEHISELRSAVVINVDKVIADLKG